MWKKELKELARIRQDPIFPSIVKDIAADLKVHRVTVYRWLKGIHEPHRRRKEAIRAIIRAYKNLR